MTHEKIIKRENGDRLKIIVIFYVSSYSYDLGAVYRFEIERAEKGKKKFQNVIKTDYNYLNKSTKEKEIHKQNIFLEYVSEIEIQQAKEELWQKLKP